jgi:hypothetical protein
MGTSRDTGAPTRTDAMGWKMLSNHGKILGQSIKSGARIRRKDRIAQMLVK